MDLQRQIVYFNTIQAEIHKMSQVNTNDLPAAKVFLKVAVGSQEQVDLPF
jgi:hypothetical protein